MHTEIDDKVVTEMGDTRIRTLSHYLLFKKPRTTIFNDANPFSDDTTVTFTWDTADPNFLQECHRRLVASVTENGVIPFSEARYLLNSSVDTKITAGKVKFTILLSPEVGAHVTFVA